MPVQPSGDIELEQNEINRRGGEPSMPATGAEKRSSCDSGASVSTTSSGVAPPREERSGSIESAVSAEPK